MLQLVLISLALVAGALLPIQAGVNAAMRTYVGRPEWAATVSFGVGTVALLLWLAVSRAPWPGLAAVARAPWWAWSGGVIGALYVTSVVITTPKLGVATSLSLAIAGQMIMALVIDQYGAMGVPVRAITAGRVAGVALLVGGVLLILKR